MNDSPRHAGTILIVDDITANIQVLKDVLTREGYTVRTAGNGADAVELAGIDPPDLVLMDVMMPKMNGFEACRVLKQQPATRLIPIVLVTELKYREDRLQGINAGADDFLTKPVNVHELTARVRSLVRLKRHTEDLDSADSIILTLALTIEARDQYTEDHCARLAKYATALGMDLTLPEEDLAALHRGGYLHDLGKIGISDAILLKPARLTPEEYVVMQRHTEIGDHLCGTLRSLHKVRQIVRHHHERLDGSGYPDGLAGDAIPLIAQIMSIVDVYDALTTARPYKPALAPEAAFKELHREAIAGWRNRDLVERFTGLATSGRLARLMDEPQEKP